MAIDLAHGLRNRLPQMAAVAQRFPLVVLALIALTTYLLLGLHKPPRFDEFRSVRLPAGLTAAFFWAFGSGLWAEARGSGANKLAAGVAGWCAIALLITFSAGLELNPALLLAGLGVALAAAPYIGRGKRNGAFWLYNHLLWSGAAISLIAMVLAAGGVSMIMESLRYLFGIQLPYWLHEKVWIIGGSLVAPVYWLSLAPRDLDASVVEGEQSDFLSRAISMLVQYILVPLLLVYALILHVYVLKILFDMNLPKGRLGWMVLSYGVVMAATALMTYPTRNVAGPMVRHFWTWWPWLVAVPVLLLVLAVSERVRQYGLTENRYLVVLAGIWLASLVVTQGLGAWRDGRSLRQIPAVAAALMLAASVGPWGMTGWSIRYQVSELMTRLSAAGLIKDGRVPVDARPTTTLLASDRQRIHSIIDYLNRQGRLAVLKPLFENHSQSPFLEVKPGDPQRFDMALADRIRDQLAIGRAGAIGGYSFSSFQSTGTGIVALGHGARLIGPLSFNLAPEQSKAARAVETPAGKIELEIALNLLSVTDVSGKTAGFDLTRMLGADVLMETRVQGGQPRSPIVIASQPGGLQAKLVVLNASARRRAPEPPELANMAFWIVLDAGP